MRRYTTSLGLAVLGLLGVSACGQDSGSVAEGAPTSFLAVAGAEGFETVGVVPAGECRLLVPLASRSERVPRAALRREGLIVRLLAGRDGVAELSRLRVTALEHATDEQILLSEGKPVLVAQARLCGTVDGPMGSFSNLPFLARQDGASLSGPVRLLPPPDLTTAHLVLIGAEAPPGTEAWTIREGDRSHALPPGPRAALVMNPRMGRDRELVELQLGEALLDQALWAMAFAPDPDGWRELATRRIALGQGRLGAWTQRLGSGPQWPAVERTAEVDSVVLDSLPTELAPGGLLELWLEPPTRAPEGRTWTFMITIGSEGSEVASGPLTGPPSKAGAAAPLFRDVALEAGVATVHMEGPDEQLDIRPTMGPGAAWGDVDGDGWVDLYLVQGSGREGSSTLANRLMRNRGDGTFEEFDMGHGTMDIVRGVGGAGMGALFFDADGDGDLDLYLANYGLDRLFENDGTGKFTDVSEAAGLTLDLWSAGVAASDVDGDGDLDLYVTSYLDFDLEKMPPAEGVERYGREDPLAMLPFAFPGQRNVFLRNEGGMRFVDATEELGLADLQGRGMQAVFWDFDRDGDDDLYVANDVSFNVLFANQGDGTFEDISFVTGLDDPRGGMGLALGDVDGDGDEDLFLTNWQLEANALYISNLINRYESRTRRSSFRDATVYAGLGGAAFGVTSWGAVLFDLESDGDLDLFVANGYTSPDYQGTGVCVGQANHLFLGRGDGRFERASGVGSPVLGVALASRAVVGCDYDQDGDLDLLVTANNGPVQLLRNEAEREGEWLGVRLRGGNGNRFAIGAEVTVELEGRVVRRSLRAGSGYLGGNPAELLFGLGEVEGEVMVAVRWPSGGESRHRVKTGSWNYIAEE